MRCLIPTLIALMLASGTGARADPVPPLGNWLTPDADAVIAIARCGAFLCGRIAGIRLDQPNDPIPHDWRGGSQCGLEIILDVHSGEDDWQGAIIDPRNGDRYRASLRVDDRDRLHLRGYILLPLLGQTQIWTRYAGPLPASCRLPAGEWQAGEPPPDRHSAAHRFTGG